MIRAGILSDTHLSTPSQAYAEAAARAFADCKVIFHAGDLTESSILDVFSGKTVYAVHGNSCSNRTRASLPEYLEIELLGHHIGLCHGTGPRHTVETRMWDLFPQADCIIYGHTHIPVCRRYGATLFINPGSFHCGSAHEAPASYAIMTLDEDSINAELCQMRPCL